jgi:hypothetical protein
VRKRGKNPEIPFVGQRKVKTASDFCAIFLEIWAGMANFNPS